MRLNLLKNTAYIAIISCTLGMTGCTTYQDDDYDVYPMADLQRTACLDNNGMECVIISDSESALYLPSFSEQTYTVTTKVEPETKTYYGSQTGIDLSSSEPTLATSTPIATKTTQTQLEVKTTTQVSPVKIEAKSEPVAETEVIQQPLPVKETKETEKKIDTTGIKTETIETKTIEIKEETTTATQVKDSSLATKTAYGEKCHDWEARTGDTLRSLLTKWGEKAGWTVIWKLDRDYHLEAGVIFRGTFTEVSGALVRSFARATPAPIGTFYKGNRVLVISTQEDENAN
ncbi:MAG: TcpQ domain-containing protein [Alphaproteobacteria bacterium]|nr:TcpQ domain-containing protein [Alphaproteobacteria bacterium]